MPGNSGAIRAGKAFVELYADDNPLSRGLTAAGDKLKSWGKSITAIGAGIFSLGASAKAGLSAATVMFADMGSELADMSGRTGASVEALSTLGFAAEQSGASMEDLEAGMKKGQKTIAAAAGGSKTAAAALGKIGLSATELLDKSPADQLRAIAAGLSSIENPAQRTAAAMEILGKGGTKLLPMMSELQGLEGRAKGLGLEVSSKDAQLADALGDTLSELWKTTKQVAFTIGAALAPSLMTTVTWLTNGISAVLKFIDQNRSLVVIASTVATVLMAVGAGLVAMGMTITVVGIALGGLTAAWGALVAFVSSAFAGAMAAAGAAFAFIFSWAGLATVAILGLAGYFAYTSGAIGASVSFLKRVFDSLKTDALAAFQGIRDAIEAGDISLAVEVLWTGLKLQFAKGIAYLAEHWGGLATGMVVAFVTMAQQIADVLVGVVQGMARAAFMAKDAMDQALGKNGPTDGEKMVRNMVITGLGIAVKGNVNAGLDKVAAKVITAISSADRDLQDAQKNFDDAVQRAATAKDAAVAARANLGAEDVETDVAGTLARAVDVRGTFSSEMLSGLGAEGPAQKIADYTKRTAEATEEIAENAGDGMTFGGD